MRNKPVLAAALILTLAALSAALWLLRPRPLVVVPDVVGLEMRQARAIAGDTGLEPLIRGYACLNRDVRELAEWRKEVEAQAPPAGTMARRGDPLRMQVRARFDEAVLGCTEPGSGPRTLTIVVVTWLVGSFVSAGAIVGDARRRGADSLAWGWLAFLAWPIAVPLWLATREQQVATTTRQ